MLRVDPTPFPRLNSVKGTLSGGVAYRLVRVIFRILSEKWCGVDKMSALFLFLVYTVGMSKATQKVCS